MASPKFDAFIASLRSKATRTTYESGVRRVVGSDPDAFLSLDPARAKDVLVDYVVRNRESLTGATIAGRLSNVKAFCDEYGFALDWKIIRRKVPPARYVGVDRAPTAEEVRRLLEGNDNRLAFIVLAMASGGFRVGAWAWLKVRHLSVRESGVGVLTIYPGEPEEYPALVSPEAVGAWARYREERERVGEKVGPDSPLVRDKWDYGVRYDKQKIAPDLAHPLSAMVVKNVLRRAWLCSGVKSRESKGEFKSAHGFRKFAKTQMSRAGLSWEDQEVLLGHRMSYYKPTLEHLEEEYLKAVPFLTISEAEQARRELTKEKEEHERSWKDMRLEVLSLKDENRDLRERYFRKEEESRTMRERQESLERTVALMAEHLGLAEKLKAHSAQG